MRRITILCAAIAICIVSLAACAGGNSPVCEGRYCLCPQPDERFANIRLPYCNGVFMFTPSCFEEINRSNTVSFRFSEGRWVRDWNGFHGDGGNYVASNIIANIANFVAVMNSISPVLVDAVATDTHAIPFEGFSHDGYMYTLHAPLHITIRIYSGVNHGYLYFNLSGRETSGLHYHSLYRITAAELIRIRNFAQRLDRFMRKWTATPESVDISISDVCPTTSRISVATHICGSDEYVEIFSKTAIDQDGNCAMIHLDWMIYDDRPPQSGFYVDTNAPWQRIYLTITAIGQTREAVLHNYTIAEPTAEDDL